MSGQRANANPLKILPSMPNVNTTATMWPDFESRIVAGLIYDHSLPFVEARHMEGPCYGEPAITALHAAFIEKYAVGIAFPEYRSTLYQVHGWTNDISE